MDHIEGKLITAKIFMNQETNVTQGLLPVPKQVALWLLLNSAVYVYLFKPRTRYKNMSIYA